MAAISDYDVIFACVLVDGVIKSQDISFYNTNHDLVAAFKVIKLAFPKHTLPVEQNSQNKGSMKRNLSLGWGSTPSREHLIGDNYRLSLTSSTLSITTLFRIFRFMTA